MDLGITSVTIDPTSDLLLDADGVRIKADVDVANLGGIGATSIVTAWLSTDQNITGDDVRISPGSIAVGAGQSETLSIDAAITESLAAGEYTLIVALTTPDDYAGNSVFYADLMLEGEVTPPAVTGTEGDDVLAGTAGGEAINALGGNDTVIASEGYDTVDGGEGVDVIDFSGEVLGIDLLADFGTSGRLNRENPQTGGVEQIYENFEGVIGTAGDDFVALYGAFPDFVLDLGAGNDVASGAEGNDTFLMGAGDDLVAGDKGDDVITLGAGADMVYFTRYSVEPFPSGDGHDRITDFDVSEDLIIFQIVSGTGYDPLADLSQTGEGALLSYISGSSILLEGVDASDLSSTNFVLDEGIFV